MPHSRRRRGREDLGRDELDRDKVELLIDSNQGDTLDSELRHPHLTPVAQKWLQSRTTASSALLPPGEDRPLSLSNIRLALSLVPMLAPRFLLLFWHSHRLRMVIFIVGQLLRGILPALKIWATSQLLDMCQESFQSRQRPNRSEVIRRAVICLLSSMGDNIFSFLTASNSTIVRQWLNHHVEGLYMSAQLSLDIPTLSDPFVSALLYEAGCFAGFEARNQLPGPGGPRGTGRMGGVGRNKKSPFQTLNGFFNVLTYSARVVSAALLVVRTLGQSTGTDNGWLTTYPTLSPPLNHLLLPSENLVVILLAFLPSLLSIFAHLFAFPSSGKRGKTLKQPKASSNPSWQQTVQDLNHIKDMGKNGSYKQEVVLFDLKDWIMDRWEDVRSEQIRNEFERSQSFGYYALGIGAVEETAQATFYALLAMGSLGTSVTLGSIRLYQSAAESLMVALRRLIMDLQDSVQVIFYMAAFFEALNVKEIMETRGRRALEEEGLSQIDYETTRQEGGMRIEARNLGFTYPGMSKPVLHDVNLVIEPGTTLAIVGFNGGGKTTLVKVLMGLYDHTGDLEINGYPIDQFPPRQLHSRTTCCFQDHSKYSLTLRENVGIGSVSLMSDTGAIETALSRGGAEDLARKVGMDGKLNRYGVPDVGRPSGGGDEAEVEDDDNPPPPPPPGSGSPPRMGRGGPPPPGGHRGPRHHGRGGSPGPGGLPPPEFLAMTGSGSGRKGSRKEEKTPLSGGQWQRLALSRAFMRSDKADLVVFDEPSAALDARAEYSLFKRIHGLSASSPDITATSPSSTFSSKPTPNPSATTTIYISHRFSTVRKADKIAVVEDGTISEMGSHEELMALQGRYAELFNLQKEGFE